MKISDLSFAVLLLRHFKRYVLKQWSLFQAIQRNPQAGFESNVTVVTPQRLFLGRGVIIREQVILHCGGQEWTKFGGAIRIDDESEVGTGALLWGGGEIVIGRRTQIAPFAMIFSTGGDLSMEVARKNSPQNWHNWLSRVVIGDYALVGARAIVMPGVTIGEGAVVGASSFVTQDVPPWTIVGGVPARVLKPRSEWRGPTDRPGPGALTEGPEP